MKIYTGIDSRYLAQRYKHCEAYFPEVVDSIPLHPREVLKDLRHLKAETIVTTSEHLILYYTKQVLEGLLVPEELKIYEVHNGLEYLREGILYGMVIPFSNSYSFLSKKQSIKVQIVVSLNKQYPGAEVGWSESCDGSK